MWLATAIQNGSHPTDRWIPRQVADEARVADHLKNMNNDQRLLVRTEVAARDDKHKIDGGCIIAITNFDFTRQSCANETAAPTSN